ncbi:MAG: carbohydrate binding family 9 domain-containing protein, partial [Halieaceae bacterium]|nr:carbohydrate binding family 9 domain-containing protein [Halieaceae bacterium]
MGRVVQPAAPLLRRSAAVLIGVATMLAVLQSSLATAASRERPSLRAERLVTPPVLDGDVLGDDAWSGLDPATGFVQIQPDEGAPASQRTEVYVGFTDDTLYVAVIAFDTDPDAIIVSDSRRDANLDDSDSFQMIIDGFQDRQNGLVFGTNPAGIQYDGQLVKESTGFSSASGSGFNLNWDAPWEVEAQIGDYGWSAEFQIPFRSLRYGGGEIQDWG